MWVTAWDTASMLVAESNSWMGKSLIKLLKFTTKTNVRDGLKRKDKKNRKLKEIVITFVSGFLESNSIRVKAECSKISLGSLQNVESANYKQSK